MADLALLTFAQDMGGISARYISSYIKEAGFTTNLIYYKKPSRGDLSDTSVRAGSVRQKETLLNYLIETHVRYLGVSIMSNDFIEFKETVKFLRERNWDGTIVVGGIHPSIRPEESLLEGVDYAVQGPGELSMLDIMQNHDKEEISGLVYRTDDGLKKKNPIMERGIVDLDLLPFPDYDLKDYYLIWENGNLENITVPLYRKLVPANGKFYYLITSRGCPYACSFCCNDNRERVRKMSVDRVMEELRHIKQVFPFVHGVNAQDDAFTMGNKKWLREFAEKYPKQFGWPLICRVMPKLATKERLRTLRKCELNYVSIGLQGSENMNAYLYNRKENSKTFVTACKNMADLNITYMIDVILDVVYEKEDDLRQICYTLNALRRPFKVLAFAMTPFPGTAFYDKVVKDNLLHKFAADCYESAFNPTRPDAYKTPEYWRTMIRDILPRHEGKLIDQLIASGPDDEKSVETVAKLYKQASARYNFALKIRNKAPLLFDRALQVYKRLKNIKYSITGEPVYEECVAIEKLHHNAPPPKYTAHNSAAARERELQLGEQEKTAINYSRRT